MSQPDQDEPQRTEAPTARKLRRATERGDVPRSPLATAALTLLGVTAVAELGADAALRTLGELARGLWAPGAGIGSADAAAAALDRAGAVTASLLLAPLAVAVALGAAGAFLQVGPVLSAKPLTPDLRRLDPLRGLSRLGSLRAIAERLAGLFLAIAVAFVGAWTLRAALPGLLGRWAASPGWIAAAAGDALSAMAWRACALLAFAGAIAAAWARWRWWQAQRMSRRELIEEQRRTEGEPTARRRRARIHRQRALGPSLQEAVAASALVIRGGSVAALVGWPEPEAPPRLEHVALGAAVARTVELAGAARLPVAFDEALAARLRRLALRGSAPRSVPRELFGPLARHFAREGIGAREGAGRRGMASGHEAIGGREGGGRRPPTAGRARPDRRARRMDRDRT